MIKLEGVRVVFGRTVALDALDIELRDGVTGLFGPNGSGKSTLLRVLAGLLRPTNGDLFVDGVPLSTREESFRRNVGYSGHQTGLYERLTVEENLILFGGMYGVGPRRVDGVIEQLGLQDRRAVTVGALSAGGKRSTSVARALVHEPRLLLLDEPYANLDDEAADRISAAVQAWCSEGRIAVIATHGAKRVKSFASASLILQRAQAVSYRLRTESSFEEADA